MGLPRRALGPAGRALRELGQSWASRRAGRRHVPNDIRRQARDVTGVTGAMFSRGWDELARVEPRYLQSFDSPRIPPSLHISARDRQRAGQAVPLAERCIEDFRLPPDQRPGPWSMDDLSNQQSSHRQTGSRHPRPGPQPEEG